MPIRPTVLAAGIGLGALLLTGCSSGSKAPETTSAAPQVTAEAPAATPSETIEPQQGSVPGDQTAPGATLAFGEQALVSWHHFSGEQITLQVEVRSAGAAPLDEILAVVSEDTAAQIQGYTPYYVTVAFTKADLSQGEISFSDPSSGLFAFNAGGTEIPELTLIGTYDPCNSSSLGKTVDEGAEQLTCQIFLVPGGQQFGGVGWGEFDSPYDKYNGSPIHWK